MSNENEVVSVGSVSTVSTSTEKKIRKERTVNIELVSRSMFLDNVKSIARLRSECEVAERKFHSILAEGNLTKNSRKIALAAVAMQDAKNLVDSRVGMLNRHFRKGLRAFHIHNGDDGIAEFFAKMGNVFPDVDSSSENGKITLSEYFSVLGENQDSE